MRLGLRRSVSWLAIYAVALHVILLGFTPVNFGGPTLDPFSVICHSDVPAAAGEQIPGQPDLIPGHACEHCSLCSASAPPAAPGVALIGNMAPVRVLHVLRPASAAPRTGITSDPKQARGPPTFA